MDLSKELSERGHEVGIVLDSGFTDRQTSDGLNNLAPLLKLGIHRLSISRIPGPKDAITALQLRKLAARLNVDVLHGHGAKGGLFARLGRIAKPHRIAVYTPHGGVLNFAPSSMAGKLFRHIEKWLLPATDAILFESAFARQAYARQICPPTCRAPVIHNGLRPAEFTVLPVTDDAFDFVFVGELRDLKGIPYLLDALANVTRPDGKPTSLLLVGGGPDEAALRAKIEADGLSDRVHMAGVQPAHAMFPKGHCVVVPSLAESLPYIVLEAVAAGKQVIATRVGGVSEIFGPTESALLPAADSVALTQAMQNYIDAPELARAEMDERLKFVQDRFSVERMTNDIEANYRIALSSRA